MPESERALAAVIEGLTQKQKTLPAKYFYDAKGSQLFDQITRLPEYYPTRTERELLQNCAAEIASSTNSTALVELGSGTSEKTQILLTAMVQHGNLEQFFPFDVDPSILLQATSEIRAKFPKLLVQELVGDFDHDLPKISGITRTAPLVVVFLGSTLGNYEPAERANFLRSLRGVLEPEDFLLLGTDLVKDPARLIAAYADSAGVTAQFNLNILRVINQQFSANFRIGNFEHEAFWDPAREWIEMRLRARQAERVDIGGTAIKIDAGEFIRTEVSAKFRQAGICAELAHAGFAMERWWSDAAADFGLSLSRCGPAADQSGAGAAVTHPAS